MAPHSSTLAWKIPWTKEPGGLQSLGSLRVGHDWMTSHFHYLLSCIGEGNGNPLQCSCLENSRDGGAWWASVYGVTQSRTQLRWLSSRNSPNYWIYMKFPLCCLDLKGQITLDLGPVHLVWIMFICKSSQHYWYISNWISQNDCCFF